MNNKEIKEKITNIASILSEDNELLNSQMEILEKADLGIDQEKLKELVNMLKKDDFDEKTVSEFVKKSL